MLFGIDIKDTTRPLIHELFGYPLSEESHVNGARSRVKIRIKKLPNGHYISEQISAFGALGFGIISTDQHDLASNKNGLSLINTSFNGSKRLEVDFKRFSFDETKHLNRYIDYHLFCGNKKTDSKAYSYNQIPRCHF